MRGAIVKWMPRAAYSLHCDCQATEQWGRMVTGDGKVTAL